MADAADNPPPAPEPRGGIAPIKPQFILPTDHAAAAPSHRDPTPHDAAPPEDPAAPRKRQRGMNKQRDVYRPEGGVKLCMAVLDGRECSFGEGCRFSHDLRAYLAAKPADLGETCPIYTLRGHCRFGVSCRYGSAHLREDGSSVKAEGGERGADEESNLAPAALLLQLRKNQYDFSRADALSSAFLADVQRQQAAANGGGGEAKGEAAAEADGEAKSEEAAYGARSAEDTQPVEKERRRVDFKGKIYLAPLTTVGNLPFRRVCKGYGVDITCGEMAMATNLLQGQASEWALMRRHKCEDVFGVQLAGSNADVMGRAAQVIDEQMSVDFIDINMGCPIDVVCNRGCGSSLAQRPGRVQSIVRTMSSVLSCPLTVKMRMGFDNNKPTAHNLIPKLHGWGAAAVTLHGRSRQQRYSKSADWEYISSCGKLTPLPFIGNGDVFSYEDVEAEAALGGSCSAVMVARGALVKPWIFTEIKERRHWDISSSERLDMLKSFVTFGLEHWGTDDLGVSRVRNFLLEWLSFLHRYVPVGLLERLPAKLQDRPPAYCGRNDLETLMASDNAADWIKITELVLGPVPTNFNFTPKHKANAYSGPILQEG
ncbi:hypothetical protein AB1Y20_022088 [Prymnesium parvum]|uniref:tRNA-dihydrouridine(47) synthase [NAD(P)(+)] n=1 Tax=Prymnesium parvum TaxID=97485 RepID=A0AB34JIL4_PRYPA